MNKTRPHRHQAPFHPTSNSNLFKHSFIPSASLQPNMADSCQPCLCDSMEGLWFHYNILSSAPKGGLSINSMLKRSGKESKTDSNQLTHFSASVSEDERLSKFTGHKNRKANYTAKRPTTLNIVIGQPIFQLQCEVSSCPPLSTTDTCSLPTRRSKRRTTKKMRSYKSSSELEYYELKGFMDLGFAFDNEALSPTILSMIPRLQRLQNNSSGSEEKKRVDKAQVRRPYLSEAWLINRPDSLLLNLRTVPKCPEGGNMKKHLRFWAKTVASLVNYDS